MHRGFVMGFAVAWTACCANGMAMETEIARANALYEAGKEDEAKVLYQQAADQGSAEGHFRLAYQYVLDGELGRDHFVAAARLGHDEALDFALDELLFRANGLKRANPKLAMEVYLEAKKANPNLMLYDEADTVLAMERCLKAPPFEADAFMEKYGVADEDGEYPFYDIWELAEEASLGGRFGTPDPGLVFNLVVRGGQVPAEFNSAVEAVYSNYVEGVVRPFDISDHITSGMGMGYCALREDEKCETKRVERIDALANAYPGIHAGCIRLTYSAATTYFDFKARIEEGHGGSGRAAWVTESAGEHKDRFVERLGSMMAGEMAWPTNDTDTVRLELLDTLEQMQQLLLDKTNPIIDLPTPDQVTLVQWQWSNFMESLVHLMEQAQPSINSDAIRTSMALERIGHLKAFQHLVKDN